MNRLFAIFTSGPVDPQSIIDKLIPTGIWPFIAQLLSTLVMLFIVQKFLYKPLKGMLDARAKYVKTTLLEAAKREQEAKALKIALEAETKKVQQSLKQLREEAQEEIFTTKTQMLQEAQAQSVRLKQKATEEINQAKAQAIAEIEQEIISVALDATKQVLKREINQQDHERLIEDFIKGTRS
jgi:F-type H+-transporting ATPase subunit b